MSSQPSLNLLNDLKACVLDISSLPQPSFSISCDARFEVLTAVKIQTEVFWVVTVCGVAASTLKMEAARSPKILVSYHNSTWCHNPEDLYLNFI
jgi:hypothetical protein